ncbi:MAG: peptidylprolyl isomerase, partial [Flavobacteriaceae bacterium]|nr:peptidylprolyl isomerase [Flavobacteriaceae bacterium]
MIKLTILVLIMSLSSCKTAKYSDLDDGMYADIETNKGDILLKLEFEKTPITVANFVSLAEGTNTFVAEKFNGKPFYDGLKFHRVVKDFIVQGGDHRGNGTGDPGYKFEDEFPMDDEGNLLLSHDAAGILSMANGGPGSNGSQFFITHKETKFLDGRHTVFGHVVMGQAVVDS